MPEVALPPTAGTIKAELQDLYRSWRILDLVGETVNELPPEWLRILEIARNIMLHRPIPGVELPEDVVNLVSPAEAIYTTQIRVERKKRVVYPVTGDTQVRPLHNLTDFPQVTLPDMMLRSISQELFDFRLISGMMRTSVFGSLRKHVARYFTDPRLRMLLEFPLVPGPSHRVWAWKGLAYGRLSPQA